MKILDNTGLAYFWASLKTLLQGKQDKLTAGAGISINNNNQISVNSGIVTNAPSTAGTYELSCSVSPVNGTTSYSWTAATSIPAPPSNNGTYLLKCVVSSGVATYSWESVTVGGSY